MTDTQLTLIAASLLSVLFSYVPKLKDWFDAKDATTKRLIMAGALLVVSAVIFGASCFDLGLPFQVACTKDGVVGLVTTYVIALMANQGTYLITPKYSIAEAKKIKQVEAKALD